LRAVPATGVSERQPALLVPGYTGSKEDFLAILESLATAGRVVVAVDQRGQYESAGADRRDGYALDQLAADLLAIAAAIAGDSARVHLLGHSFGGIVARQAALTAPDAFLSLTLLGSGPGTIAGERAARLGELLEYLDPAGDDIAKLADLIGQLWESELMPQAIADGNPPEIIEFLRDRTFSSSPLGLSAMAGHLLDCPDRTSDLAAGAAHSPAVEAPETTAAMLTAFWNQAESTR
jgi:pimeloyl-ACP methyl ester carboxylesterase